MRKIIFYLLLCTAMFQFMACTNASAKKVGKAQQFSDYEIVSEQSTSSLEMRVESKLLFGYSLVGGVSFDGKNYNQAVAK